MKASFFALVTVSAFFACLGAVRADDFKHQLDSGANPSLFQTHFAPYGNGTGDSILAEPHGLRFRLASGHSGLYSYFALAGNFEFSADYELLSGAPPAARRVRCGIAVETESSWGNVALTRGSDGENGTGYVVAQGKSSGAGRDREPMFFPSGAVKGVLVLRREGKELICLAADGQGGEPYELCRLPFTDATIRKVRVFADSGSTALDARMSINIKAEEVTGGTPQRERGSGLGWWLFAGLVLAGMVVCLIYRRWRAGSDDAEKE